MLAEEKTAAGNESCMTIQNYIRERLSLSKKIKIYTEFKEHSKYGKSFKNLREAWLREENVYDSLQLQTKFAQNRKN